MLRLILSDLKVQPCFVPELTNLERWEVKFLSLVLVTANQGGLLQEKIAEISSVVEKLGKIDYELIVVDNASRDESLGVLRDLTSARGIRNLQVFSLAREVDYDSAAWVGVERALGDNVIIMDPFEDDPQVLPSLVSLSESDVDVIFAVNSVPVRTGLAFAFAQKIFHALYQLVYRVKLIKDASRFRMLSREVVVAIQSQHQPNLAFRTYPASSWFKSAKLDFTYSPPISRKRSLRGSVRQGVHALLLDSSAPLRLLVALSLLGAILNLVYSAYVVLVALSKPDVQPGWISLSLQSSLMFFLILLVMAMLAEYVLHLGRIAQKPDHIQIKSEFTSVSISHKDRLNVDEVHASESKRRG